MHVAAYAVYESRRINRISQRPVIVGHEEERNSGAYYCYRITNKGNGSAFFTTVDYFLNQVPLVETTLQEAVRDLLDGGGIRYELTTTRLGNQTAMQTHMPFSKRRHKRHSLLFC